ncbi:methyltransferase domain-containing protein [Azospirillum doebereinerae]|uniref:Methyltransferase domain-containing protein n=2 Tax=Azospirillum doebereinerae TaxID=92933 RepID=A0A433JE83_9PROT|nr:methyltransferase domain-containing protein [Azospirillum doebereinerae]
MVAMLVDWAPGPGLSRVCPICRMQGDKPRRLVVRDRPDGGTPYHLYGCPSCGGAFFDPPHEARYEEPANADGAVKFYVEQGAGIDVMLAPTAVLDHRPVRRYLEIGCGFGFSLDYAQRARGWIGRGYDPGLLAQTGREALGLDIRPAYFTADTPLDEGAWDAVFCSEVIEHVPEPSAFLATARRALASDGILVLTTPNAAGIVPETDLGALLPLLSAGFHTMLFSAEALRKALLESGFVHVRVEESPHQLQAMASDRPLGDGPPFDRLAYRDYLTGRVGLHEADSPLGAGFRCRLLKEFVNAGEYEAAKTPLAELRQAWVGLYGIDLDDPAAIRFSQPGTLDFDTLAARFPFNLCSVLYMQGMLRINAAGDPAGAALSFGAAAAFAALLRSALQGIGTDDGETADLGAQAPCEQILALARFDPAAAAARYAGLTALPAALRERTRRRLIVALVNAGAYASAESLVEAGDEGLAEPGTDVADRLSLAFVVGMLKLNHRADQQGAAETFHAVYFACRRRLDDPTGRTLLWPARYHEALALSHAGRMSAAQNAATDLLAPAPTGAPEVPSPYRAWAQQILGVR